MRKMITMFFGTFVGSTLLTAVGFMGPPPYIPGFGGAVLMLSTFGIMVLLAGVDRATRREFMRALKIFRLAAPADTDIQDRVDDIQDKVIMQKPLVDIAHDIGYLHGDLVARGMIPKETVIVAKPESSV